MSFFGEVPTFIKEQKKSGRKEFFLNPQGMFFTAQKLIFTLRFTTSFVCGAFYNSVNENCCVTL
jgi:hypothetical protein